MNRFLPLAKSVRASAFFLLLVVAAPARAQDVAPDVLVKNVTLEVVDLILKDSEIRAGSRARSEERRVGKECRL